VLVSACLCCGVLVCVGVCWFIMFVYWGAMVSVATCFCVLLYVGVPL